MKNIKELTEKEAKEILEFVYPGEKYHLRSISFEPVICEDGRQQLTFGLRSIIGIEYHNGQDKCILHFDNTKVVLWLYKNGYDILEQLETNKHLSEMESDFEIVGYELDCMSKGEEGFREGYKQNWTLDYVKERCKELVDKYYYKMYE